VPLTQVVILGLDSMPPQLLFDRLLPWMPRFSGLLGHSRYGILRSTHPPITVPAWATMFTGMDPGTLGLYGFRHRRPGTYFELYSPTPRMLLHPPVWDTLSRVGRRVCVVGMPPGYPPPTVNGVYVGDLLTPAGAPDWVSPPSIAGELNQACGGFVFDVTFRAGERARVAEEILDMTRRRFRAATHLWRRERWDFFALHDIGPDRMHHAFWKFLDPGHPRYREDPGMRAILERYYRLLDQEIAGFLDAVGPEPIVLVVSDHGSQAMEGAFCVNEWLRQEGYLSLLRDPTPGTPLEQSEVDWGKTRVWGAGGYYARLQFNVRGREPLGIVDPTDVPTLTSDLRRRLGAVRIPSGEPLSAEIHRPQDLYREVRGDPPDLLAYFGGLRWRSAGTMGHGKLFLEENDTGPDDSVHSMEGVVVRRDELGSGRRELAPQRIENIGPTVLRMMRVDPAATCQGTVATDLT
jgi:predicted AlkP superfamily phosphohydrolase/phosphomutase